MRRKPLHACCIKGIHRSIMRSKMDFRCVFLVSLLLLSLQRTEATYSLEIRAVSYSNPEHKAASGRCCDLFRRSNCDGTRHYCNYCDCDNRFFFCLRGPGTDRDGNTGNCPLGTYSVTEIGVDSFNFNNNSLGSGVPNPMLFQGSVWPGGVQLYINVIDEDVDLDDHVDDIYADITLSQSSSFTSVRTFTGDHGNSRIGLSFRVGCSDNFYGSDCATFCDRTESRTCEVDNLPTCQHGWSYPANNCRTPICARGCHPVGGYCNTPGECTCNSGWTGEDCDRCIPPDTCLGGYCNRPGQCLCSGSSASEGQTNCEMDNLPCSRSPCLNGATCVNDGLGGYSCSCQPGYMGTTCQVEVNECDPNPCSNGGSCTDSLNRYSCSCAPGFFGSNCETVIDECLPQPCINQGTCVDLVDGYSCTCFPEFTGFDCEIDLNRCRAAPCQNGGTCTNGVDTFFCQCPSGYMGHNCDLETVACLSSPCQNGDCFDISDDSFYYCDCASGYTGMNCEIDIPFSISTDKSQENIGTDNVDSVNNATSIIVPTILTSLLALALLIIACLVICVCKKRKRPRIESNPILVNSVAQLHLDNPVYDAKLPATPLDNPMYMEEPPIEESIRFHNPMYRIMDSNSAANGDSKDVDETSTRRKGSWVSGDLGDLPQYSTLQYM